ncbi:MAG: nucleotidyltransferase domain-containing protein [Proteobacteria bacterium]|nr:nucleotidyltransferase domain-containing protein [Pseudomonadota bacterium]
MYGSRVRGDNSPESDLDIVIECPKLFSLYDLVKLQQELSRVLGIEAHVTTYRSLDPGMQDDILKDEVRLFG